MPESKPFGLSWGAPGSPGEAGDVESTVRAIREKLGTDPRATVRLSVGTRQFGERVLRVLEGNEDELARVTVVHEWVDVEGDRWVCEEVKRG